VKFPLLELFISGLWIKDAVIIDFIYRQSNLFLYYFLAIMEFFYEKVLC
jgi:hypothetical protein